MWRNRHVRSWARLAGISSEVGKKHTEEQEFDYDYLVLKIKEHEKRREFEQDKTAPVLSKVREYFGSWTEAKIGLGQKSERHIKHLEKGKTYSMSLEDAIRKYPSMNEYRLKMTEENLPPYKQATKKYGSWTKARIALGLGEGKSTMTEGPTTVYLLHITENIYKVGITQQVVEARVRNIDPNATILETLECETLKEAKRIEKLNLEGQILYGFDDLVITGYTELFVSKEVPTLKSS